MSLSSPPSTEFQRRHPRRRSSSHGGRHDVFVSFRGEDTRTTLTGHLVNYLRNSGVNAFFDQIQIKAGEHIRQKLRRAIAESAMYVVVFSENYPDSRVCLWELETIVEAAKKGGKQILAIFYGVTRDDVRLGTDLYGEKLSRHNAGESAVGRWEECLRYAAEIDEAFTLTANTNEDDADLCQQTLERVHQLMIGRKEPSVDLELNLRGLPNFVSNQSSELFLASSKSLCIEDCNTLDSLFSLPGRKQLEELKVRRCHMLTEIPCLGELESLKVLIIEDCMSLMRLPNLSKLVLLEVLCITICPSLIEVLGLSSLESLVSMEISNCDNIHYVDITLFKLHKLENFLLENCFSLRRLGNGFSSQNLQSRHANIHGCPLLGISEPNRDNDGENFQLSEDQYSKSSANPNGPVSWEGSSSSASSTPLNTNEQGMMFKEMAQHVLASQSVAVYPSWYPDSGATTHLTNNTCKMIDSDDRYHGTGKVVFDHEEYSVEHTKEQQETFEELDSTWIFIDHLQSYPCKEDIDMEAALAVLRHFFSSGIEMAAGSVDDIISMAAAIQVLLSENVTSKGDAWKRFSRNVRMAYFYCMSIKEAADDDEATLHETLLLEAASEAKMIGHHQQPLCAKMEANHVTLLKAIKNELQAQDFERAASFSHEWLLLVKQQWDLLAAAHL